MPQGFIRITSRPEGGAPPEIRDEWIGLVLPVHQISDDLLSDVITGELVTTRIGGYEVLWSEAMDRLGAKNQNASIWWKENIHEMSSLIFDESCCEAVPD